MCVCICVCVCVCVCVFFAVNAWEIPFDNSKEIQKNSQLLLRFPQTVNLLIHYYALNLLRDTEILLLLEVRAMNIFFSKVETAIPT
jgi:hypothetical protein